MSETRTTPKIQLWPWKLGFGTLAPDLGFLCCILFLATALRLSVLSGERFHPDEALYATWARLIATGQDVWLKNSVVDKPPLFIYALALLFGTLGASEEIARLPNLIASLCTIVLTYGIARELYREQAVALWAALILSLSPLALLFAPTAFTDPMMLCWLLASVWLSLRGKHGLGGFAYGLSLATKQDALLFAPLIALQIVDCRLRIGKRDLKCAVARLWRFLVGLSVPLALVVLWTAWRAEPDFLRVSLAHYGGFGFAAPEQYAARVTRWLQLTTALSSAWLLALMSVCAPLIIWRMRSPVDAILWTLALYWSVLHVAGSFPVWDRYLLPLAPVIALLLARTLVVCLDSIRSHGFQAATAAFVFLLLVQPARAAIDNEIHVARDFQLHAGLDQVGQFFWQIDTTATVVYMHELSWELDYYTFGIDLDRRWVAEPEELAADARSLPWAQRFVVLADWEPFRATLLHALAIEGLKAEPVFITHRSNGSPAMYVYLITPLGMPGTGCSQVDTSAFYSLY